VVSVSGSGNIEVSNEAKLAFSAGGKVDEIYVEEGDHVTKGKALAKLDITDLELALTQAQIALTQARLAVSSANVTLRTAKHSLGEARDIYTWPDIQTAQADVDDAKAFLQYVLDRGLSPETLVYAQARLTAAEAKLDAMVKSYDTEEVAIKKMEVEVAEQTLVLRQQSLEQAQQALEQAQKQLNEATITAPFDGVVANVLVDEGDVIPSPTFASTTIVYLVDPTSMKLEVEVDEIDTPGMKVGQRAVINVDALPDVQFDGKVTSIYPVPVEQAGVVVYRVKIDLVVPEGSEIRVGMSTDADIIINERSNVMLVPDRAIEQDSQGNNIVQVKVNGGFQPRSVVTGISDGLDTEIIDGLKEGEIVLAGRSSS
jgi:RND family efflux transporter MFP subunit